MRAMNLSLRTGAFDDLLSPGDRVDVLLIDGAGRAAGTVAQNLLVLAVGLDLGGDGRRRGARAGGKVALAITLDQGHRLAEAERRGELRLLLRHPDDVAQTQALTGASGLEP
jgi:Flp pilus assembly protein CpaB